MATITWGTSKQTYQGVDKVAFFVKTAINAKYGFPWDGVTAVNESPSGAEPTKLYADNKNYNTLYSLEEFAATVEAYQVPKEFDQCDGIKAIGSKTKMKLLHQERKPFVLAYRENVCDENGSTIGHIYHIVLNCKAAPSAKDHATINDSPEAATLSYELSTTAADITITIGSGESLQTKNYNTAHVFINTTGWTAQQEAALEAVIYNDATNVLNNVSTYVDAVFDACPTT